VKIPVCFPFAGPLPRAIAERLIASVRNVMPSSHIYQLTDLDTEGFKGCEVVRLERGGDFQEFFFKHLVAASQSLPRFIVVDYDCVFLKNIADLYTGQWKVGLTKRDSTDRTLAPGITERLPYNNGVIFSDGCHTFFQEAQEQYLSIPNRDGWMDAQEAVKRAVMRTSVKIQEFPCSVYNYTPVEPDEDLKDRAILHYKGMRKHWALEPEHMHKAMLEGDRIAGMVTKWMGRQCKESP